MNDFLEKGDEINRCKGSLSRREFTKRSILAIAGLATTGLIGYTVINSKKLRTVRNIHRMGHCAPSVMQTLLEINDIHNDEMVLYAGAMAGGIAGSKMECGALTAPLMFLGFQNNKLTDITEKLDLIAKAQSYINEFTTSNGSLICSKIRHDGMPACMSAISNFYKQYLKAVSNPAVLSDEAKDSYKVLLNTFDEKRFHCSLNVLNELNGSFNVTKELLDSSWLFIGGIAMRNQTCGALAAGVMALSSVEAKIENSYSRVARMNRLIRKESNEVMNEDVNNFNQSINSAEELGTWFRNEFGSTTCFDILGFNFSRAKDVESYISGSYINKCALITDKVAHKVDSMI